MVVVRKNIDAWDILLGAQEIENNKLYRAISFCFFTEKDGKHIVYNTLTGEIAELDENERALLNESSVKPSEAAEELIKRWYLVPMEHDDIELCDEFISFAKAFEKRDGIKGYTIFTTTDCNARCFYCYELGCKKLTMDEKTAADVAEYIIANAPSNKKVDISWFGGEPLCNSAVIDIISEALEKAGIEFAAHITSNGYLFDEATACKAAKKWNIKAAQITLDGTEKVYNDTKAYIYNDDNAFKTVTDNIEELLKNGIKVSIRVNMGAHNKEDLFSLVDWVSERYKEYDNITMYPRVIMEYDEHKARNIIDAKDVLALEEYCKEKKLLSAPKFIKVGIKSNFCMADTDNGITVLPDGRIGKCEHCIEKDSIGDIYNGITDIQLAESFKKKLNSKELCKGCALYPVCIRLEKCPDVAAWACDDAFLMVENAHMTRNLKYTYKKLKESK